jgi:Asp-tRNA(Asn)/Glu-tRNA(Gln) amidotransferase B subunit
MKKTNQHPRQIARDWEQRTGYRLPSMKWLVFRLKEYGYGDMVQSFQDLEYVEPEQMDEAVRLVYREGRNRLKQSQPPNRHHHQPGEIV